MTRVSRRKFLASVGAVGAATLGVPTASATPPWLPDHVIAYGDDRDELAKYQPRLVTNLESRQKMIGMYGWYADSSRYDTRVYNYWCKYTHQDGTLSRIPFVGGMWSKDGHLGDHEPFSCFVNRTTGEVQEVVYTGYHHYAVHLDAEDARLASEVVPTRETHVPLRVTPDHHHYELAPEGRGVLAENVTNRVTGLKSFVDFYPRWDDNGVWDSSDETAVTDPWSVKETGTWWDKDTWDYRMAWIRVALNWRDSDHDQLLLEE